MRSYLHAWDLVVYRFINLRLTDNSFDWTVLLLSSGVTWVVVYLFALALALTFKNTRAVKILGCVAFAISLSDGISYYVLKPYFQRVRPCHYTMDARRVNGICGSEFGMPSNHAANGMAATTVLAAFASRTWFLAALISTLVVGFTRVYLGVHFVGDVLAGYVFGIVFGAASVALFFPFMLRKNK